MEKPLCFFKCLTSKGKGSGWQSYWKRIDPLPAATAGVASCISVVPFFITFNLNNKEVFLVLAREYIITENSLFDTV
jgi:hypothetical protein